MKSTMLAIAVIVVTLASAPACAQVQEGPLADPAAPVAPSRPQKPKKTAAKAHHRKATAASAALPPASEPTSPKAEPAASSLPTSHGVRNTAPTATDPVSFGLKWNGANDTGEKTRVQNYDNNAAGSGAEVGMKLHF